MSRVRSILHRYGSIAISTMVLPAVLFSLAGEGGATDESARSEVAASDTRITDDVQEFCTNIADDARDLRYAKRDAELKALQSEVEKRIAILEEKNREFEAWIARRNEFQRRAQENLVEIYAKMRPDAAALRLEVLGAELAAAILTKLPPRQAGVILNEMDVKKAALVTGIMSAAGQKKDPA